MKQYSGDIKKISDNELIDVAGGRSEFYAKTHTGKNNFTCFKCGHIPDFKDVVDSIKNNQVHSDWICPNCNYRNVSLVKL